MVRLLIGFVAGTFYGAIVVVEVPGGGFAKAVAILKMFIFE